MKSICTGKIISVADSSFAELFIKQANTTPEKIAAVCGDESITYGSLLSRARAVSGYLLENVGSNVFVGLCLRRSINYLIAIIGTLLSGNIYVPLDSDTLNPGYENFPADRFLFMLEDTKMSAILIDKSFPICLKPNKCLTIDINSAMNTERVDITKLRVSEKNLVYGIYTSGSTGKPKLTLVENSSVVNLFAFFRNEIYTEETSYISVNAPFGFDASVQQLIGLLCGYTLNIFQSETRNNIHKLIEYIHKEKIEILDCTPSQLRMLIDYGLFSKCHKILKKILVGGEEINWKLWSELRAVEDFEIYNVYGPTECTVDSSYHKITKESPEYPVIGRPISNCKIYIVKNNEELAEIGEVGEIYISGAGVSQGYFSRDEINKDVFVSFMGERCYRSGDMGKVDQHGNIIFQGRVDKQVKIRSHRIELGEIEKNILSFPYVEDTLVAKREINGYDSLVAYILWKKGKPAKITELSRFLSKYLPLYMLPNYYVEMTEWPLLDNNKKNLQKIYEQEKFIYNSPNDNKENMGNEYIDKLSQIFKKILNVNEINIYSNFMELGGDSLRVMMLLAEIYKELDIEIDFTDFFQHPTIEGVYQIIRNEEARK